VVLEPEIILKAKERARRAGQKGLLAPVHTSMHYHVQPSATKRERTETKKKEHFRKTAEKQKHHARISKNHVSSDIR
jgi:hypothetical protein